MVSFHFSRRILGRLLFAIGVLLSALLMGGLSWAGVESVLYGFPRYTTERFDGLVCPPLMMRDEMSVVRVVVRNPSTWPVSPVITLDLSAPGLPESSRVQVKVEPGQTQELVWAISSANIDRRYFVFAKANRSASYPLPGAEATCGTLVLDMPFLSGMQILAIWLGLCLGCILLGLWVWRLGLDPSARTPGIATALAVVSLIGLFAGLNGIWMLGGLALVVMILLAVGLLRR
jgi:hypothetical protein